MLRLTPDRRGQWPVGLTLLALGGLAATAIAALHLDRLPFAICAFKALTGLPCLTCGTTRTLGRLARLDLRGAIVMNPLAATGALAIVPWAVLDVVLLATGRGVAVALPPRAAGMLRAASVAVVLGNWLYLVAAGR